MSSLTVHVAEQPDILAADAPWRKQLSEIVEELTENFPGIKRLLGLSTGCDHDAVVLFDASDKLMKMLNKLEERQRTAVASLEKHQAAWSAAIAARDGKLGELDARLIGLTAETRESECTARNTREQNQQAERQLALLTEQLSSAEANLRITQATETMIKQSQVTERERLHELESRLNKRKEDLDKQEKKQDARFSTLDAQERGKMEELTRRERELETREKESESIRMSNETELTVRNRELDLRLERVQNRENAAADSEVEVQQGKSRNKSAGQNLQRALSILQSLANATGSENNAVPAPTLDNIENLAASIRGRYVTLQETISETDRSLADQQDYVLGIEEGSRILTINHERQTQQLNQLRATSLNQEAALERLAEARRELADMTIEHDTLLDRHTTLEAYHRRFAEESKTAKEAHKRDQVLLTELRFHRIPRLEAAEQQLRSQVKQLTEENRKLRAASDVDMAKIRSQNTLIHDKAAEASVNKESLRNALQGVKDLHAINDTLNTNILASSERLKTAAGNADALRSEIVGLKSRIANVSTSLSERTTECQGLKAAAEETKATVASLESQCSEKNAIITNLEDEAKLAASCAAQKVADLEADVGDRNSQIQALDKRHRTLQSELESELEERDSHIQLLNQDRQSLEAEKGKLSTHIAGLQETLKKLRQEMNARDENVDILNASLSFQQAANKQFEQQIEGANGLHQQLSAKNAEIALSKAKCSKAAEKNRGLAEEIKRVKESVELLNRQLATATESLQVARASNESLTKQADEDQKERNRLQAEIQSLRVVTLPEKEGLIKKLNSEAAEQKRQASASQSNLTRQIGDIQKQVSELQDKIVEQDAQLREFEGDYARLQTAAEHRSNKAEAAETKLTDSQATIESLDDENVQLLRRNADLTAALERCTLEHSDLDRVVEELDRLGKENAEVTSHRDALLHSADGSKAELERLTARLRSCHCSDSDPSRKRPHDQVDPEEERVSSPDRPRRLDKAPESVVGATTTGAGPSAPGNPPDEPLSPRTPGSRGQGTATGSNSEGQVEQPLVLRPGTKWRIDDVLNKRATAHPIPQVILTELRRKIGSWERQRANWRAGSSDRLPKCAESYALKRGTQWVDGDSHRACSHCTARKQLCAALTNHHIELLPANGDPNSGLGVADSRYWVES